MSSTLCLNAGSSSLKCALFEPASPRGPDGLPRALLRAEIDASGPKLSGSVVDEAGRTHPLDLAGARADMASGARRLLDQIARTTPPSSWPPKIVVHRIVHGGTRCVRPTVLTPDVMSDLESLSDLAPLHQKPGLEGVRLIRDVLPKTVEVACFDTAFHAGHAEAETRYAIPSVWHERGYRRYGFHGLSYESVARRLPALLGDRAHGAVVVAHLGSGASLCGLRGLRSVTTTMGLTALDGLVMATRPGSLDPGLVLRWMQHDGLGPEAIEDLLYHHAGLLGVSGLSGDVRELVGRREPEAALALELFVASVVRHTGAVAAALGGFDALVFTGGVGFHQPAIRDEIVRRLGWLGFSLDPEANGRNASLVSRPGRPPVLVLEAREEEVMALGAWEIVGARADGG